MKLKEALNQIENFGDDLTIFVQKDTAGNIHENSEVVVCSIKDFEENKLGELGYFYLLEVFLVKDVLGGWSYMRHGKAPNDKEKCGAVVYYSINDSYLPPDLDHG